VGPGITIEHVMPQTLTNEWRNMLGDQASEVHARWLHTIGNLTLSGYNPDMSNDPFEEKREVLRVPSFRLNSAIVDRDVWNEEAIVARGRDLAARAVGIWSR